MIRLRIGSRAREIRSRVREINDRREGQKIYERVKDYTMVKEHAFCDNLALARKIISVSGCIVECGVWRGGMSAGLCAALGPDRTYFLFDSFKGLPEAHLIDGPAALEYQQNKDSSDYHDNCTAPRHFAHRAMESVGARKFELIGGWFHQTLPSFKPPEPIALLRLDADWYESTMTCLNHLFDYVAADGLIILDDYYTWDGCSRALHDFLSSRKAIERIRSVNGSVCYLIRDRRVALDHRGSALLLNHNL